MLRSVVLFCSIFFFCILYLIFLQNAVFKLLLLIFFSQLIKVSSFSPQNAHNGTNITPLNIGGVKKTCMVTTLASWSGCTRRIFKWSWIKNGNTSRLAVTGTYVQDNVLFISRLKSRNKQRRPAPILQRRMQEYRKESSRPVCCMLGYR